MKELAWNEGSLFEKYGHAKSYWSKGDFGMGKDKKKTQYVEEYSVFRDSKRDSRNTNDLTDDEYYKLYEDDRMIFKEK